MTVQEIRAEVHKLDPNVAEDSDTFRAALILLSALQVGTRIPALVRFTELPQTSVSWIVGNIRRNRIFTRSGHIRGGQWFEEDGGIAFWMDVCCALGLAERTHASPPSADAVDPHASDPGTPSTRVDE